MIVEISLAIGLAGTCLTVIWFLVKQEIKINRLQDQHTALARAKITQQEEKTEDKILLQAQIEHCVNKIEEVEGRLRTVENRWRT